MEPFPRYVHPQTGLVHTTQSIYRNITQKIPSGVEKAAAHPNQMLGITLAPAQANTERNETLSPWMFGQIEDTVILPIILSIIALLCWLGNGIVMYSILRKHYYRSGFSLMLLNICISDVIFISFSAPTAIVNHATYGSLLEAPGMHLCKFVHYITFVTVYVVIYTCLVACVFRFFGEFMSDKGKTVSYLSKGNAMLSCFVVWVAFILSNINFLVQKEVAIFQEPFICIHSDTLMEPSKLRTLWVTFLTCAFLIPLTAIGLLSAITLLHQSRQADDKSTCPLNGTRHVYTDSTHVDHRTDRQQTIIIMAAAICRAVCWVPIQIFVLVDIFGYAHTDTLYRKAEMLSVCIAFLGSCVNPILFYCLSRDLKNAIRETFSKIGCTGCEPVTSEDQGSDMNETIMSIISESSNHINY